MSQQGNTEKSEPVIVEIPIRVKVYGPGSLFMRLEMASGEYQDGTKFDIGMIVNGSGIVLNVHGGGGAAAILCKDLVEPLRRAIEEAGHVAG